MLSMPSSDKAALCTVSVVRCGERGGSYMSLTNFFPGYTGRKMGVQWDRVLLLGVLLYHKDMGVSGMVDSLR
jgi:hypothetical protein